MLLDALFGIYYKHDRTTEQERGQQFTLEHTNTLLASVHLNLKMYIHGWLSNAELNQLKDVVHWFNLDATQPEWSYEKDQK